MLTSAVGDVIAKLTDGDIQKCAGKEIDEDGDVYNSKNQVIGHVTLLEDIPPEPEAEPVPEPEPTESPEEIEERKQLETDKKLAGQLAMCVQQSLDKINPILKMISDVCRLHPDVVINTDIDEGYRCSGTPAKGGARRTEVG
jgi:Protein of unknown function (DUF3659)